MKAKQLVLAMVAGVTFAACGSKKAASIEELQGEWVVVELNGTAVSDSLENTPFLGFEVSEKRLYGNSSCNNLMGTIQTDSLKPGSLSFASVGSTMMMCPDMTTEEAMLNALKSVQAYEVAADVLTLKDAEGKEVIELKKK